MSITIASIVTTSKDQVHTKVEDESVILGLSNSVYYGLDPVGTVVWREMQEPKRVADLVDSVMQEYDVDRERCEEDVIKLLNELLAEDLVQVCESD